MKTQIIAEIASSHNGDIELAKAMIKTAASCGADLVKFQDWKVANVPENDPDRKRYQTYEFPEYWYPVLIDYCKENGVEFLTSCFNVDRIEKLASYGIKKIKLASISLTNTNLLMMAGAYFDEVIASTAMHTDEEIETAIELLASNAKKFSILHCVANYPTKFKDAQLSRIDTLKKMTEGQHYASVGYSDHAIDPDVSIAALSKGISYLEKHFTLSRHLPQIPHQMYKDGPLITTHQIAIEPHELRYLAHWRDKIAVMYGDGSVLNEVEQKIKNRYSNRYGK